MLGLFSSPQYLPNTTDCHIPCSYGMCANNESRPSEADKYIALAHAGSWAQVFPEALQEGVRHFHLAANPWPFVAVL